MNQTWHVYIKGRDMGAYSTSLNQLRRLFPNALADHHKRTVEVQGRVMQDEADAARFDKRSSYVA